MNRIRLATGPLVIFGTAFVVALLLFLPMRLAAGWFGLPQTGLAAREVRGSVWAGSLREATFGDLALGDLRAGLSPFQLLVGRARVGLAGTGPSNATGVAGLRGAVGVTRHSFGIDDVTARLPAGNVFAPVPVSGLDFDDVTVRFQERRCVAAEGRVRATLTGDVAGITLTQGLNGTARCDAGALLLPLASQSGTESADIRLWSTGRFRAELTVQPSDPALIPRLVLSGFQQGPRGYVLAVEGRF